MKKITSLILLAMSGAFLLASCGEQPAASSQPTGSPTDSGSTPAAQQITVKFNTDGGSAIADVKVDKGGKVAKPADPTKDGYTFGKWYEDSIKVTEFDFDTPLSSDITLYASWVAATPSGSDSGSDSTPVDTNTLYFRDDYWWNHGGVVTRAKFDDGEWVEMPQFKWVPVVDEATGYNYYSVTIPDGALKVTILRSYATDTTYGGPHTAELTLADRGTNNMYDVYKESTTWPGDGATVEGVWAVYDGEAPAPSGSDSGQASDSQPAGAVQYTVTALPWWMPNGGSTLFAWAWGGQSGDGAWYPITIEGNPTSGTEGTPCVGTFSVPAEVTGFNMARCKAGTTSPNWTVKGDAEGRIYNKSGDVTCTAGTHSYESPAWTEYNPK